ncbi:ABC-F family ATP-binding cassette domain-containing protein [Micrococcoides hystricis]|uniref:ABC-F family ATP-binding cassette domain-containing protein n=1 Tax=Micrococcoides hystricis TaxID=1572761 RepID=A0ABV6PAA6_9MICC
MAHLLGCENIGISFGTRTVLESVSLGIDRGQRIGIVGRNGDGKSTLMRILAGVQEPDHGRVTARNDISVGYLAQRDSLDDADTVSFAVVGERAEHEWAADPKIRDVIDGLLTGIDWNGTVGELSGGQRRRVALAQLLAGNDDVLFLDEPTNHLDIETVHWLAEHLKNRWRPGEGALLVITHDRWFLDEVATNTWEVHDGIVEPFEGGYAAYMLARVERDRQAAVVEQKRQQLAKKELAWLRRGAPARTSKPKFRIDAANAVIADVPEVRDKVALTKMATARLGKDVIDVENMSYQLPEGRELFDKVTLRLAPGERIGILGINGAGKTTLVRLMTKDLEPTAGRVKHGKTIQTAVLDQNLADLAATTNRRVIEVLTEEKNVFEVDGKEVSAGSLLETLGFAAKRQWTPVKDLSGGEQRRLQLLKLLVTEPNVLFLDEPTNDLDTDTLAAVEDLLDSWPGTLIVISHDRYFLERVTDHQVALLGDGKIRDLPAGVDEYLRLRKEQDQSGPAASTRATSTTESGSDSGPTSTLSGAERQAAQKEANATERKLNRITEQIDKLEAAMHEIDPQDFVALGEKSAEITQLRAEQEELEERWLELSEILEG